MLLCAAIVLCTAASAVERVSAPALFNGRAMLNIDGKQRFLRRGQTSPEGVTLVESTAKRAIIEFDGVRRELPLGGRVGGSIANHKPIVVQLWPDNTNMYRATGQVNGRGVNFLVDTGATSVVFSGADARRLGIDFETNSQQGYASTASGITPIWVLRLDSLNVSGIVLRNVEVSVTEGSFPEEPLLGMSFLSRIDMRRQGKMLELTGK